MRASNGKSEIFALYRREMTVDLIPERFYTASSENSTLVSRLFVPNSVNDITSEKTKCIDDTESGSVGASETYPTSVRTLDVKNNTKKARPPLRRSHRLTSDDFISEKNPLAGRKTSCEHLSQMTAAENDLELFGFCDPRTIKGLVPERFLPSLVTFKDKVPPLSRRDINQNSLESPVSGPPYLNWLLRRFTGDLAGWKLPTPEESDMGTSVQSQECETEQRRENKISVCSNCGCYVWAKQTA